MAPRFRVLYGTWRACGVGDRVLDATTSPVTTDALAPRTGQVDCHLLAHSYHHLSALVSTS